MNTDIVKAIGYTMIGFGLGVMATVAGAFALEAADNPQTKKAEKPKKQKKQKRVFKNNDVVEFAARRR